MTTIVKKEKVTTVEGLTDLDLNKTVFIIQSYRFPKNNQLRPWIILVLTTLQKLKIEKSSKLKSYRVSTGLLKKSLLQHTERIKSGYYASDCQSRFDTKMQLQIKILKILNNIGVQLPQKQILKEYIERNKVKI